MNYYKDKVVMVTGASSGLGLSLLRCLLGVEGCLVIASTRSPEKLRTLVKTWGISKPTCQYISIDLDSRDRDISEAVKLAFGIHGRVNVLINCAGMGFRGCVSDTGIDIDRRVMQVDYFGQIAIIKALLSLWNQSDASCGDIIQISSVQGFFGLGERAPYSAAKHALLGFIDSLRVEIDSFPAPSRFKVIHVCPGHIATNHSVNSIKADGTPYAAQDESTLAGYSPEFVASQTLARAALGVREIIIADMKVQMLMLIRTLFPLLCFRLLRNKQMGRKESFVRTVFSWMLDRT